MPNACSSMQVMGRFGDKVEDEKHAEEVLKVLKGQIMERQIEQVNNQC